MKKSIILPACLFLLSTLSYAQSKVDVSIYPAPKLGTEQYLINLPTLNDEQNHEVEVFVGKTTSVDNCNRFFLIGTLEEQNLEGWGYTYHNFKTDGNIGATMMGCNDKKMIEKTVYAQPTKVRYNSRLPIVVYAPKGYTVEYRTWSADNKMVKATQK